MQGVPGAAAVLELPHLGRDIINSYRFPAQARLKLKRDFYRVQTRGKKLYSEHFLIIVLPSASSASRLGITVTRKVDKRASARNRLKRRIREAFRGVRSKFTAAYDVVVIARRQACECENIEIEREILGTLQYRGFLNSLKSAKSPIS